MSAFDVSASDLYLASGLLALALTVSWWWALAAVGLGVALAVLEFQG